LDVRVHAFALLVLALDDFGFRRMHLQVALRQTSLKLRLSVPSLRDTSQAHRPVLERLCFLLVTAVHQSVVRIPTPREVRVCLSEQFEAEIVRVGG
jgi:hypothetical protein